MNIEVVLDGVTLPTPHIPFINGYQENATDNITLDGTLYTDWVNQRRSWSLTWVQLSKAQYDQLRGIYNAQFTDNNYPVLEIDYYGISAPVKVTINDKNIWNDGECIRGVEVILREQWAFS